MAPEVMEGLKHDLAEAQSGARRRQQEERGKLPAQLADKPDCRAAGADQAVLGNTGHFN